MMLDGVETIEYPTGSDQIWTRANGKRLAASAEVRRSAGEVRGGLPCSVVDITPASEPEPAGIAQGRLFLDKTVPTTHVIDECRV